MVIDQPNEQDIGYEYIDFIDHDKMYIQNNHIFDQYIKLKVQMFEGYLSPSRFALKDVTKTIVQMPKRLLMKLKIRCKRSIQTKKTILEAKRIYKQTMPLLFWHNWMNHLQLKRLCQVFKLINGNKISI